MFKKMVKISLISLTAILVISYLVVMFALSPIVSKAVATFAPEITGCEVTIEDVDVSFFLNGVTVRGITVGNPEGFKTDSAFELVEFSVDISLLSLLTDEIVVKEVVIDGAKVTLEQGLSCNNLSAIGSNVDAFLKKGAPEEVPVEVEKEDPEVAAEGSGKKLVIENFYFRNAEVRMSAVLLQGAALKIPMADIHLKDIGKSKDGESEGASIGEVVKEVYYSVLKAVTDVTSVTGEGVGDAGKALVEGIGSVVGDAVELIPGFGSDSDEEDKADDKKEKKSGSLLDKIF